MAKELPPAVKDLLVLVVVFGVILGGLYAFTGVWPPAVIVESGSMMHRDDEVTYGRFGTIDPGDMVLVKRVDGADDVTTWADGGRDRYGAPGDVIIYYKNGQEHVTRFGGPCPDPGAEKDRNGDGKADGADECVKTTPIIHRAMAWVDVVEKSGEPTRYLVRWAEGTTCPSSGERSADGEHCEWGREGITVNEWGVFNYKPDADGFITKGDNPFSNPRSDQTSGLSRIVEADWIQGKARGEIPWLGLIKLSISSTPNERNPPEAWVKIGNAWAPQDLWVMLGVSLFVLVGIPVGYDAMKALEDKKKRNREPGSPVTSVPGPDSHEEPPAPAEDAGEDAPGTPPPRGDESGTDAR